MIQEALRVMTSPCYSTFTWFEDRNWGKINTFYSTHAMHLVNTMYISSFQLIDMSNVHGSGLADIKIMYILLQLML
jgi:hypothetical protein